MPILQNKSLDTRNKLKKLVILDFKIFSIFNIFLVVVFSFSNF